MLQSKSCRMSLHYVKELQSDHKEADTNLLFHAKHASASHEHIVIHSPYNDVAVIATALSDQIQAKFYFSTRVKNRAWVINTECLKSGLGEGLSHSSVGSMLSPGVIHQLLYMERARRRPELLHPETRNLLGHFLNWAMTSKSPLQQRPLWRNLSALYTGRSQLMM